MTTNSSDNKKNKSSDLPPPTVNAPLSEKKFTNFYLTMLVLSTIGTSAALVSLAGIPSTMELYGSAPAYAILGLAGYVVTLVSVVALILLWRKDINGLYLKIGTYIANILLAVGLIFTSEIPLKNTIDETMKQIAKQGQVIDKSLIETVSTVSFYAALSFGIVVSIVFALLWWFAWKNQRRADD